ncbi:MAG: hypothetical protein AAB836_02215, partial [Patescibacteria group bacterium]
MYKIKICESFKKQISVLCKKNRKLFHEIRYALLSFQKEENIHIGRGVYKLRHEALPELTHGVSAQLKLR